MELLIDAGANIDVPREVSVVHTSQRPLATEPPHVQALVVGVWIGNGRDLEIISVQYSCPCFVFKTPAKPRETILFMLCPMHTSQSPTHNHAP